MSSERNKPATPQKLRKSRADGEIAQAPDAVGIVGTLAAFAVLGWLGPDALRSLAGLINLSVQSMDMPLPDATTQMAEALGRAFKSFFLTLVGVTIAVTLLVSLIAHKGIVFSTKALIPNLARINPVAGIKQIYGPRGLTKFAQGFVRLLLWLVIACVMIAFSMTLLLNMGSCGVGCIYGISSDLTGQLLFAGAALGAVAAIIDMRFQRLLFLRDQRMNETELRLERKEQFGAPEIRSARKSMQHEFGATDAIGPNRATMCFFDGNACVALRYHPTLSPLPRISATSVLGPRTIEIRSIVRANGHPELEHPALVRALQHSIPGMPVNEAVFEVLVQAMAQLYAAKPA